MEDQGFVRQDFYIQPPQKNASAKEWEAWIKADNRKAAVAKAQYTKSLDHHEMPEEFAASTIRKVNGVWQQSTAIGFTGDAEEGTCQVEAMVEADQPRTFILADMERERNYRGKKSPSKSKRRRRNKKRR